MTFGNIFTVFIGALMIGLALGLLGSGGSAITVPVLVYLLGHSAKQSIAESMAIVGIIAAVAAVPYARARQIDWKCVRYFGVPGMLGAFMGAWLGSFADGSVQLVVFGAVLVAASLVMLRKTAPDRDNSALASTDYGSLPKLIVQGTAVGIVTGFVGVGGGFLIVPALVLFGHRPMRLAIGTSLVIIALNTTIGFAKNQYYLAVHQAAVDWNTIIIFVLIGIAGSMAGKSLNAHLNQPALKKIFAVFLVMIGGLIMVREGGKLTAPPENQPLAPLSGPRDVPQY